MVLVRFKKNGKEIRTFSLSRISNLEKTKINSDNPPKSFNPISYFNNSIGITSKIGEEINVTLSFTPKQAVYLKEKPLHTNQVVLIDDSFEFRISLKIANNYELHANILSYGENVKVIEPISLKKEIINRIQNSLKSYNE